MSRKTVMPAQLSSTRVATHSVIPIARKHFQLPSGSFFKYREHRATNLHRLATRRCDKRRSEGTPLDCPCLPNRQVFGFRNEGQHLDRASRGALVGRSRGGLLADPAGLGLFDIRLNIFVKQEPLATEAPRGMRYLLHVAPMGGVPFFD